MMSDRKIMPEKIEKILNSYTDKRAQDYVTYKLGSELIKKIPSYDQAPAELNQFIRDMKGNPQVLKDVIYLLAKEHKIVITTNKAQTFFQKVMIMPKS